MNLNYYNKTSDFKLQARGYYPQKIDFFIKNLLSHRVRLNRSLNILDLACNDGKLGKIYLRCGKVYGIDLNKKAVIKAKEKGIIAICGDALKIDNIFKDYKFDVIIAGDIIEHIFDTDLFIKKVYSLLRADGLLLLSTPNLLSLGRRIMAVLGINPFCEYSSEKNGINVGHIRYYTYSNIREQLIKGKFKKIVIKADTANVPFFFLDKIVTNLFPKLGRELLIKAYKE